ncbi:MAG: hypothetical protein HN341_14240, partial [Verrucomicrobia bacterium]|nr:hypothetical protein [Verrucomicrobiota bacterium]
SGTSTLIGHANGATGTVTQTGGIWDNNSRDLVVGNQAGSIGTYQLSGGVLTNCSVVYVGNNGIGTFELSGSGEVNGSTASTFISYANGSTGTVTQSGGTWNNNAQSLVIGSQAGAVGTYQLSGGVLTNCETIYIGNSGSGTFELSASGLVTGSPAWKRTTIGESAGSAGLFVQTGGTFNNADNHRIDVGNNGTGTYQLSGGVVTNLRYLSVGRSSGTGTAHITGDDASIHVAEFSIHNAASKMKVAPDSGGISVVNASGNITLNGTLEVDLANRTNTADLVLIDYGGTRTGQFAATNILTQFWSADIEYDDVGKQVKLINISPPGGSIYRFR